MDEARVAALKAIGLRGATSHRMAELALPTDFLHSLFVDGLVRVHRVEPRESGPVYMLTAAGAKAIGRDPALAGPG